MHTNFTAAPVITNPGSEEASISYLIAGAKS
jgi:hypothetical protein